MAAFDAAVVVADFVADSCITSLELPHMTTGQRKATKKLLELYPDIRCDSYGFGADRRLHLFKKGYCESSVEAQLLSDTHLVTELEESACIQSSHVPSDEGRFDFASIAKLAHQRKIELVDDKAASEQPPELILPLTSENLQIRNTFIHLSEAPSDERVVQSMPHGMFKQCLLSEAVEAFKVAPFCNTPTSAGGDSPMLSESDMDLEGMEKTSQFSIGALVKVEGLIKLPAYNGCSAVVQGWDETTERYSILIASPGGLQQAKIKEENLSMLLPCP
mmetsp:Transcript_37785/g.58777  ORF Transcript_37785/g.58777 Transcript_37785/m.58777 type:complete len:276 (+) Transcript_37785:54-881(+)